MNPQQYSGQPAKQNAEDYRQSLGVEWSLHEARPLDVDMQAEQAARAVMHPESYDPEWRYYHGAWGG